MKIFKEEQRFTQWWLVILLITSITVPLVILISEYNKGKMTINELLLVIAIIIFSCGFIFLFKLKTRIDETGIHYQFFPFHLKKRTITWNEIKKIYVRTYSPISEYGGWGIKGGFLWNKQKGIAYNVSGDIGIQLELKNGKKILIGTKIENDAKQVLTNYNNKITTL